MSTPAVLVTGQDYLDAAAARLSQGDPLGASALAREALDKGLEHAIFLNLRAYWHESEGRYLDSLNDLERAHAIAPQDVPVLNALGHALGRVRRYRQAADMFAAAAAGDPSFFHAHLNRAWMLERAGELDASRQAYETYLTRDGAHVGAHGALASLAARRSDWASAKRHATTALTQDPRHVNANYAMALAELATEGPATAIARLTPFASDQSLPLLDRALLRGALADAEHAALNFDAAFDWYTRAAEDLRLGHARDFAGPGQEDMNSYVQRVGVYIHQTDVEETKSPRPPTPAMSGRPKVHGFLVGFPRSGTTLLENVLGAHPDVRTSEEKEAFAWSVRHFMAQPDGIRQLCRLDAAQLQSYRDAYWAEMAAAHCDTSSRIFLDKHPLNTIKLPLVARLFPEARVIFALRDPRDVVLSCFRRRFAMNPAMYEFTSLERTARFYDTVMSYMLAVRNAFELNLRYLRYEDLVAEFDARAFEMCGFLDIPWTEDVRQFAERAKTRAIATPSSTQVGRGVYQDGAGQWRYYRRHLEPILPILKPWIERFGYATE